MWFIIIVFHFHVRTSILPIVKVTTLNERVCKLSPTFGTVLPDCNECTSPSYINILVVLSWDYAILLSEAEYSICLLCLHTGVDFFPWAAFGRYSCLKTSQMSGLLQLNNFTKFGYLGSVR